MQFISHITSLIAWQCVKASPNSTEDQVTVCQWLASFILVRVHPTHQTNSDNIHLLVCCVYAVLTVFSASTCPLHCLCLSQTSTHWLLQYLVPSVCWRHSAVCHSGRRPSVVYLSTAACYETVCCCASLHGHCWSSYSITVEQVTRCHHLVLILLNLLTELQLYCITL